MGGGAWWAAVHGVAEGRTRLRLHFHFSLSCTGEGNGDPLQCSCLENPRDRGAWSVPSVGSHRVGHDRSDLAAAVVVCVCSVGSGTPCVLLPLEWSPEPGTLSNPGSPDQTCDPQWKHRPSLRPQRVPSAAGRPYWLYGARLPRDCPHSSRAGALGRGWRPEGVCSPPGISRLCASSQLLPTYLSLNCSEGALMTALLHVSTTQSRGSQTSFKPEVPVISPINQR